MFLSRFFGWLLGFLRKKTDADNDQDYHVTEEWTPVDIHSGLKIVVDPRSDPNCNEVMTIDPSYTADDSHHIHIVAGTILLKKVDNVSNPGGWYWTYYRVKVDIPKAYLFYKDPERDGTFETRHRVRLVAIRTIDDDRSTFYVADASVAERSSNTKRDLKIPRAVRLGFALLLLYVSFNDTKWPT